LSTQPIPEVAAPKACTHCPYSIESCQDGYLLLTSNHDSDETQRRDGVVINAGILLKVMERNVMEWKCGLPVLKELGDKVGAMVRALASLPLMWPVFKSRRRRHVG